jgi:hypothetical protein
MSDGIVHRWEPSSRLQRLIQRCGVENPASQYYGVKRLPWLTIRYAIIESSQLSVRTINTLLKYYYQCHYGNKLSYIEACRPVINDSFALFLEHLRQPLSTKNPLFRINRFGTATYEELRREFQEYL